LPASSGEMVRQPWLRSEVAVALTASPALGIAWVGTSAETTLKTGGKESLSVKLTRGEGANGPVRLSLITSQSMPRKKIKVNNQDKEVDDVERALRLEGSPTIGADQTEASVPILVPKDLNRIPYDLAVRGELLGADGKSVVTTTVTPVLRVNVVLPPQPAPAPPPSKPAVAGSTGKG
jgi:hypothetical protein